jgi:N-methylhydantoinase A
LGYRVAVDVGGTFTDLCALDEKTGNLLFIKDSTTPANFAHGVVQVIRKSKLRREDFIGFLGNGSTIVINAITERKGAKTGLITTKGFRDVLEIQRSNRTDMYNFRYEKPKPFVPRHLIFEVDERLDFEGNILRNLDEKTVQAALEKCKEFGLESLAVCLYNSYSNTVHEEAIGESAKKILPEVPVTLSHELTREWREYERTNTAVMNAFVQPVVDKYLTTLTDELKKMGVTIPLHVMQSNGGVSTFDRARETPIYQVESGPIGGIIGAAVLGKLMAEPNVLSLDVGGTTAKTSVIDNGEVRINTDYKVARTAFSSGYPVKVPVVDIVEIGSGGGSIVWANEVGSLNVGPQSASADPGPACYGKGGNSPTVTDAFLLTGVIDPDYFLGGEIKLQRNKSQQVFKELASTLGRSVEDAAIGAIQVATANMINAVKLVSVRRGYDPRDFAIIAFGGGGPMFATALARELGVERVIIPRVPGVFSALGMLLTDIRHDFLQTKVLKLSEDGLKTALHVGEEFRKEAAKRFEEERVATSDVWHELSFDMRYVGQEHTVNVPVSPDESLSHVEKKFHSRHYKEYTFRLTDPLEIVNIHLASYGRVTTPKIRKNRVKGPVSRAFKEKRACLFENRQTLSTSVFERDRLPSKSVMKGPAIIEEPTATTILRPGERLQVDPYGNLVISVPRSR